MSEADGNLDSSKQRVAGEPTGAVREAPTIPDENYAKDYMDRQFDYIRYLNDLYERRANYLLVANTVFFAGLVAFFEAALTDATKLQYLLFGGAQLLFFSSTMGSVWAFLPKVFDAESPFHTTAIKKETLPGFVARARGMTKREYIEIVGREAWVVSAIVEHRNWFVTFCAFLFFAGVVLAAGLFVTELFSRGLQFFG